VLVNDEHNCRDVWVKMIAQKSNPVVGIGLQISAVQSINQFLANDAASRYSPLVHRNRHTKPKKVGVDCEHSVMNLEYDNYEKDWQARRKKRTAGKKRGGADYAVYKSRRQVEKEWTSFRGYKCQSESKDRPFEEMGPFQSRNSACEPWAASRLSRFLSRLISGTLKEPIKRHIPERLFLGE
jgi:hypothetical protein